MKNDFEFFIAEVVKESGFPDLNEGKLRTKFQDDRPKVGDVLSIANILR